MSAKKILYLLPQPFLLSRGSSFRALATLEAATDLGYSVDLLCYPIGEAPVATQFRVLRSASIPFITKVKIGPSFSKSVIDIPFFFKAQRLVRENRYDLIHGVEEAGLIASYLGRKFKVPYVYDMHSWMSQQIEDSKFIRSRLILDYFKKFELQAMNKAKAIITVGPQMTSLLQGLASGVPAYSLLDCPLKFSENDPPDLKQTIVERFFGRGDRVIVYTGNFHSYQGIDLLVDSIFELKKLALAESTPFRLLLVGGGAGEEQIVNSYKKKVTTLGLEKEIIFCGAFESEAMPIFMKEASLLVSSRVQGNNVPLKIYTYLASGNLLVATNISSHTQVLNTKNSILADPNAQAMGQALYKGLYGISEEERSRIVQAAREIGGVEREENFRSVLKDCYEYSLL